MELDLSFYYQEAGFKRNGLDCYLCGKRNKLIIQTPEERIRQAFIQYLIIEKKVPLNNIAVEYPLSRTTKTERRRADLVVYGDFENKRPVLVIECKKADWILTERDVEQAKYYNSILKANCIVITNGISFLAYKFVTGEYKRISLIPTFQQLLRDDSMKKFVIKDVPNVRHFSLQEIELDVVRKAFIDLGAIGEDTSKALYTFIINIHELLFDETQRFTGIEFMNGVIIKDIGVVFDSFGNVAGGNWTGDYRKFLIRLSAQNHVTVGIGIFASGKNIDHPKFGNTKGYTYLNVSIDDYEKSHNSLQLNIDKNVFLEKGFYTISHDGKLTNGKRGSVKSEIVKRHLVDNAPHLIPDGQTIALGIFPENELYFSHASYVSQFIANLIEYALLRDEIRRNLNLQTELQSNKIL